MKGSKNLKLFNDFYKAIQQDSQINSTRKAHGPHVKADTKVDITNVLNTQFVGSVYAGTPA